MLDHLTGRGGTAVELLPVHYHIDDRTLVEKGLVDPAAVDAWVEVYADEIGPETSSGHDDRDAWLRDNVPPHHI